MGERKLWVLGALAVLALAANGARADEGPRGPRQPPPEALKACVGLAAGATCTVQLPDHTVSGTCRSGPDGTAALVCAPAHGPGGPGGHRGPPPEAIKACAGLAAGTACTAILPDRTVEGTCRSGPDGAGPVACAPAKGPGHGGPGAHRGPPPESIQACASHAAGDACAFQVQGKDLAGVCRNGPDGQGALHCAPARPPPHE